MFGSIFSHYCLVTLKFVEIWGRYYLQCCTEVDRWGHGITKMRRPPHRCGGHRLHLYNQPVIVSEIFFQNVAEQKQLYVSQLPDAEAVYEAAANFQPSEVPSESPLHSTQQLHVLSTRHNYETSGATKLHFIASFSSFFFFNVLHNLEKLSGKCILPPIWNYK